MLVQLQLQNISQHKYTFKNNGNYDNSVPKRKNDFK